MRLSRVRVKRLDKRHNLNTCFALMATLHLLTESLAAHPPTHPFPISATPILLITLTMNYHMSKSSIGSFLKIFASSPGVPPHLSTFPPASPAESAVTGTSLRSLPLHPYLDLRVSRPIDSMARRGGKDGWISMLCVREHAILWACMTSEISAK